jgi:hypothetical protein
VVISLIKLLYSIPQIYLFVGILNLIITGVIFVKYPEYLQRLIAITRG